MIIKGRTVTRTERYVINGKEYHSLADVPPAEREQIERLLADRDGDGIPDILHGPSITDDIRASTRVDITEGAPLPKGSFHHVQAPARSQVTARQVVLLVYLVVFMLSLGLGVMALYHHFLPSANYARRMEILGIAVPLVLAAPLCIVFVHASSSWREKLLGPVLAVALFFIFRDALVSGVPAVLHRFTATPAELVVTVAARSNGYVKTCGYHADVLHPSLADEPVCDLDNWVWRPVAPGDQLKLMGSSSAYGFAYDPGLTARIAGPAVER